MGEERPCRRGHPPTLHHPPSMYPLPPPAVLPEPALARTRPRDHRRRRLAPAADQGEGEGGEREGQREREESERGGGEREREREREREGGPLLRCCQIAAAASRLSSASLQLLENDRSGLHALVRGWEAKAAGAALLSPHPASLPLLSPPRACAAARRQARGRRAPLPPLQPPR